MNQTTHNLLTHVVPAQPLRQWVLTLPFALRAPLAYETGLMSLPFLAKGVGARAADLAPATPRLYNVLEIERDFRAIKIQTRRQQTPDGDWDGWPEWPGPKGGDGKFPYYTIKL